MRDDRCDVAIAPGEAKRVLERLLDHVADPPGGRGDEHAEWKRRDLRARELVAHELIANLRTVAVHQTEIPSVEREIHDCTEALSRVRELIADRAVLARGRQRVAAQGDDGGSGLTHDYFLGRLSSAPSAS